MLLDLINWGKVRRAALYALVLLLCLIVQNAVFSRVTVLGARCLFLPAAAVAVGLFEGGVWGGVFGLCLGLLGDMAFAENRVLFTVLFPVLGFFAGFFARFVVNRRFFSYVFLSLAALVITAAAQLAGLLLFHGAEPAALLWTGCKQTLWSLPFTAPLYLICKGIYRRS